MFKGMQTICQDNKLMSKFILHHVRYAGMIPLVLFVAAFFCSCEPFLDYEGDCHIVYKVKFKYTMNILEADAFPSKVKSVSLFIFDHKTQKFVDVITESGSVLAEENYAMTLQLKEGTYDFIAWCGLEGNENFALDNGNTPQTKEDLICRLYPKSRADALSETSLAPLWHGQVDAVTIPKEEAYANKEKIVATIDLTKDTNTIRVVLQHYKGKELIPEDYEFFITDDNGILNWDNELLPCDNIIYREWSKESAEVSMPDEDMGSADRTAVSSLLAELDVARLVKEGHRPILTVTRQNAEKPVLRLPLIDLLLVAKGDARHDMGDQEYLDRQDEYNIIFFLDDDGWYINGGIWINSWHIRDFSFTM